VSFLAAERYAKKAISQSISEIHYTLTKDS
jgi:hypothetical protein